MYKLARMEEREREKEKSRRTRSPSFRILIFLGENIEKFCGKRTLHTSSYQTGTSCRAFRREGERRKGRGEGEARARGGKDEEERKRSCNRWWDDSAHAARSRRRAFRILVAR